jgi:hypothetical protein
MLKCVIGRKGNCAREGWFIKSGKRFTQKGNLLVNGFCPYVKVIFPGEGVGIPLVKT